MQGLPGNIEELVLSGKLFNGGSRSNSPVRTPSPDAGWHDEELALATPSPANEKVPNTSSVGMGPGRTGVKGVIRDRDEVNANARAQQNLQIAELNKRMEKASLGGKTFLEEQREDDEKWHREEYLSSNRSRLPLPAGIPGRFGHLREVGVKGYVRAVEQEARGIWVVVHLYDESVDRCQTLDDSLARLARTYSDTKFLRARAASLGFASPSSSSHSRNISSRASILSGTTLREDDEDDPYADGEVDDDEDEDDEDSRFAEVDTDMLPTMLVYRDGELKHNWVRVDWELGAKNVEEFLGDHGIIRRSHGAVSMIFGDDDEDWDFSDEDDGTGPHPL